ncbi:hypothetical protein FS749_005927 [Ceratobasidium sp. UAMH 11750]|nr:hypothetical protein FS749_005927 [Ceratobasidium sp. UAMH 11750]
MWSVSLVLGLGNPSPLSSSIFSDPTIIWIISPLNVIEHQMAANYNKYDIPSMAVNASTLTPTLLKEIENGK